MTDANVTKEQQEDDTPAKQPKAYLYTGDAYITNVRFFITADSLEEAKQMAANGLFDSFETSWLSSAEDVTPLDQPTAYDSDNREDTDEVNND
jgi:hypothetical protein